MESYSYKGIWVTKRHDKERLDSLSCPRLCPCLGRRGFDETLPESSGGLAPPKWHKRDKRSCLETGIVADGRHVEGHVIARELRVSQGLPTRRGMVAIEVAVVRVTVV